MKIVFLSDSDSLINIVESVFKNTFADFEISIQFHQSSSITSSLPSSRFATRKATIKAILSSESIEADFFVAIQPGSHREFDQQLFFVVSSVANSSKTKIGFGISSQLPSLLSEVQLKEALFASLLRFNPFPISIELPSFINVALTSFERNQLSHQIQNLEFSNISTLQRTQLSLKKVEPLKIDESHYDSFYKEGINLVQDNGFAVVILAGGMGSRLGSLIPKALLQLDIPSHSSLIQLQLLRVKKITSVTGSVVRVYIMTSDVTHDLISAYLISKNFFGLKKVKLFKQKCLPCRTSNGEFVLKNKAEVFCSPNGNGGVFSSLFESKLLDEMKANGVKYVQIHPIDNALVLPVDPLYIGAVLDQKADCGLKVVKKISHTEKMGTVCMKDSKTVVVEYSEILPEDSHNHEYGNTAIHMFSVDLIEKAAKAELPYHLARKIEETINGKEEVLKYEKFIFDAMELAESCCLVEVAREEEFAPVKNSFGSPTDSPETAKSLLVSLHKRWANDNGINLEGDGDFEIRPEVSLTGEGLDQYFNTTLTLPFLL